MLKRPTLIALFLLSGIYLLSRCTENKSADTTSQNRDTLAAKPDFGGYDSQVKWGEHLVTIAGCNDCHTPKKMTAHGPDLDSSLLLSGHPAQMPIPTVNRKEVESKGLAVTDDETTWVGPWGVSFSANLTSDPTGLGNWNVNRFIYAIRNGAFMGMANTRPLLPPMPWQDISFMTDGELKAVFAYLQSIKPVKNTVPDAQPPLSTPK